MQIYATENFHYAYCKRLQMNCCKLHIYSEKKVFSTFAARRSKVGKNVVKPAFLLTAHRQSLMWTVTVNRYFVLSVPSVYEYEFLFQLFHLHRERVD